MKYCVVIALLLGVLLVLAGCSLTRAGLESASYKVVRKDGPFQIREYAPMKVVSTPMDQSDPMEGETFMRLFRYISKGNEAEQKIAMTTPVFMTPQSANRQMSFVLPKKVAAEGAPNPTHPKVILEEMEGGRFAAYRFSGSWDIEKMEAAVAKLASWLEEEKIEPAGYFLQAGYDPPFTPSFLRRNEVLVRIPPDEK